jgi:hypothetical protein
VGVKKTLVKIGNLQNMGKFIGLMRVDYIEHFLIPAEQDDGSKHVMNLDVNINQLPI